MVRDPRFSKLLYSKMGGYIGIMEQKMETTIMVLYGKRETKMETTVMELYGKVSKLMKGRRSVIRRMGVVIQFTFLGSGLQFMRRTVL